MLFCRLLRFFALLLVFACGGVFMLLKWKFCVYVVLFGCCCCADIMFFEC